MSSVRKRAAKKLWLSAKGIDREVLFHEIPRYLGPDASIRPCTNDVSRDDLMSQRAVFCDSKVYLGGRTWLFYQSPSPIDKGIETSEVLVMSLILSQQEMIQSLKDTSGKILESTYNDSNDR